MKIIKNNYTSVRDNKITLTDANGKEIQTNIGFFTDFSTDSSGSDVTEINDSEYSLKEFSTSIVDSEGSEYEVGSPDFIKKIEDGTTKSLEIIIESTHSGDNLNNVNYTEDSMINDCDSWREPFPKPIIKNHDTSIDPIGRAVSAEYSDSEIVEGRGTINLKVNVSDKDAMIKFADGRYRTVSVSGSAGKVSCNICGKNIVKDGVVKFCGHFKGNTYSGKKAIWQMEDIKYKECSVVNTPADIFAQVKQIKSIEVEDEMAKKKVKSKAKKPTKKKCRVSDNEENQIDLLLEDNEEVVENNEEVVEDNTKVKSKKAAKVDVEDDEDEVEVEDEVSELKDEVTELKAKIKKLKAKIVSLEDSLEEKDEEIEELEDSLEELEEVADSNKEKAISMAKLNKALMIKHILVLDGESTERKLRRKKASELNEIIEGLEDSEEDESNEDEVKDGEETVSSVVPAVANPSLVVKDNSDVEDEEKVAKKAARRKKNNFDIWGN